MVALFIDTATERGVVALLQKEELLFQCELPTGLQNSLTLMPTVQNALKQTGLTVGELSLLIAGIGPGSYTGIRVGAVVAKTLSFASNRPLVGISTLQGLIPSQDGSFAAVIDAKIGGVYVLFGEKHGDAITYHSEPQMGPLVQFAGQLATVQFLVTPQARRLQQLITSPAIWLEKAPDAAHMGKLALKKWAAGQFSTDGSLEVLYLRKTQAEIEKDYNSSI